MEYINNHTQEDFEDAVGDMTNLTPEQEDYILEQAREKDFKKNAFLDDPRLEDEIWEEKEERVSDFENMCCNVEEPI